MTAMDTLWLCWRFANMTAGSVSVLLFAWLYLHRDYWHELKLPGLVAFATVVVWCAGYVFAMSAAIILPGGEAGPWTAMFSVPLIWSTYAAVLLWRRG